MDFGGYFERSRRRWQNPEIILGRIGLKPDFAFVDVGCGNGFFAIPAAQIVGENGTIYGLDINTNAISSLRETARRRQLRNLVLRVGRAEDTVLCESCADIVFFANDLHDFEDPNKVLANAMKMLKPSGRLVDVDWKKKNMMITGPPLQIRLSEEEAGILIRTNGFEVETAEEAGPYHYMIVAKRAKEL